jgi:CRP-like cAMP-binding protein
MPPDFNFLLETLQDYGNFSDDAINKLLSLFVVIKVRRKQLLVKAGDVCDKLYFINKGMLRTFLVRNGEEITTWVEIPGSFETATSSFMARQPAYVNLQAVKDSELFAISRESYDHITKNIPELAVLIIRFLEEYYTLIETLFYSSISLTAEERYQQMQQIFPDHFKTVPLKYMASMMRVDPATLSRIRKRLTKKN